MFTESAELYDLFYGSMKDYAAEARAIAALIERERPGARAVLDVACGSGEHARHLAVNHGLTVDGIDLDERLLEIARRKHAAGRFDRGDMREFELARRYDAVVCLFSSIGYACTLDGVTRALRCFRAHLKPAGVVIVEPWFTPDAFAHGRVHQRSVEGGGVTMSRMGYSTVVGRTSRIHFEYLIGTGDGIKRASEDHELGLFTIEEMLSCFAAAGLQCQHEPVGLMNRGMYVARVAVAPGGA